MYNPGEQLDLTFQRHLNLTTSTNVFDLICHQDFLLRSTTLYVNKIPNYKRKSNDLCNGSHAFQNMVKVIIFKIKSFVGLKILDISIYLKFIAVSDCLVKL